LRLRDNKPLLLIPVENQVRELDAKLLLACVTAKRGFCSIIGPRRQLEFRIPFFPRSIFVSKDVRSGNGRLFRILRQLGHISVAWDEEGIINHSSEIYYRDRFSPIALKYVSQLFAWGPNNAEVWRQFPELPDGKPIHITGNPRGDMLRVEIRPYFEKEVQKIKDNFGDFILINTSFSHVNAFTPTHNVINPTKTQGEEHTLGRSAKGMDLDYALNYTQHIQSVFEDFKQLLVKIDETFPDIPVVVRPHPDEDSQIYHQIAARCRNIRVTNEGNVLPWLIAAKALIQNGCTTGVEAYALSLPTIAYRATVNELFDGDIFHLPNSLSHECFNFDELQETLGRILSGKLGAADEDEKKTLFSQYYAAQDGPLASERIADILEKVAENLAEWPQPSFGERLKGRYRATRRRLQKQLKSYLPNVSITPEFERHRYPGISPVALQKRVTRFQQVLNYNKEIKATHILGQLYKIST
jgi:surface carbohydrate biosynthesis protein